METEQKKNRERTWNGRGRWEEMQVEPKLKTVTSSEYHTEATRDLYEMEVYNTLQIKIT